MLALWVNFLRVLLAFKDMYLWIYCQSVSGLSWNIHLSVGSLTTFQCSFLSEGYVFFGSSTTYSISSFFGGNSTHLMVNPLNEQRCGVYPSCVDHFLQTPWLFHGFSTSLWVYPRVTPSCREVREESLGRRSHYRSHVTRRAASPANHPFLGETRWFFQHPEMGKCVFWKKSYGKRWSNYTAPYLSIFSIRSIHFKAREIIQFIWPKAVLEHGLWCPRWKVQEQRGAPKWGWADDEFSETSMEISQIRSLGAPLVMDGL